MIAATEGQSVQAAKLFGAAKSIREQLQITPQLHEQAEIDQAIKLLRNETGEQSLNKSLADGSLLEIDDAISLALEIKI